MKLSVRWLLVLFVAILLPGCSSTKSKSKQLARVAKDWSLVIRASQVVPVYPLTEDLQPGDIFFVQTSVEDEVRVYEQKGFLPFDQLVTRLQPTNYNRFYLNSYGTLDHTNTPYHWRFPVDPASGMAIAPRAGFPSYNFSVKRGGGVNLALPVQGVPVAMNLMGASSAQGSITIADAYTFGVDSESLLRQVRAWAKTADLRELAAEGKTNYLRIVNRVYLTGRVNISMVDDSSGGGALSGGASKPVTVLSLETNNSAVNYARTLDALNASVADAAAPGGSLKFAAASSRSVTMSETFPRPLVIGYLGFDLPILAGGKLGAPVSTHSKLNNIAVNPAKPTIFGPDETSKKVDAWLKLEPSNVSKLRNWLNDHGYRDHGISNVVTGGGEYAELRSRIMVEFKIK